MPGLIPRKLHLIQMARLGKSGDKAAYLFNRDDQDSDGDGMTNLEERAFGGDSLMSDQRASGPKLSVRETTMNTSPSKDIRIHSIPEMTESNISLKPVATFVLGLPTRILPTDHFRLVQPSILEEVWKKSSSAPVRKEQTMEANNYTSGFG